MYAGMRFKAVSLIRSCVLFYSGMTTTVTTPAPVSGATRPLTFHLWEGEEQRVSNPLFLPGLDDSLPPSTTRVRGEGWSLGIQAYPEYSSQLDCRGLEVANVQLFYKEDENISSWR